MYTRLVLVCLLCVPVQANVQKSDSLSKQNLILRDRDYAFSISIPPNWAVDTADRALQAATKAVLYSTEKDKDHWRIPILIATKALEGKNTLANLISYFERLDSSQQARTTHIESPPVFTKDGTKVTLIKIAYVNGQCCTAYVEDRAVVVVFSQWRLSDKEYQSAFEDLKQVVESYSSESVDQRK